MTIQTDIVQSNLANKPIVMQDANGIEAGQMCTAWCVFNGVTGTLTSSFNVASIVRNAAGKFTVTFLSNMANPNYAAMASAASTANSSNFCDLGSLEFNPAFGTASLRVTTKNSADTYQDKPYVSVAIFGGK